jgi:hypothetical protein
MTTAAASAQSAAAVNSHAVAHLGKTRRYYAPRLQRLHAQVAWGTPRLMVPKCPISTMAASPVIRPYHGGGRPDPGRSPTRPFRPLAQNNFLASQEGNEGADGD